MEKTKILANISSLTAEQLFNEILQGHVTLQELMNTGNLSRDVRKEINELLVQFDSKDNEAWERARYGNEVVLSDYVSQFPIGKHVQEAKEKIQYLEQVRRQAQAQKQKILDDLKLNPNSYFTDQIIKLLQDETITREDLRMCNIPDAIIDGIYNIELPRLQLGDMPEKIPAGYTEVYFWGIPGSGKTCALAALLSTAHKLGYLNIATGPGYDYMTCLKNIFVEDTAILPPPSPVETTQYLPFTLKKASEKHSRSVSLIELSGEIFQCFYYKNAGLNLPSQSHENTFNSLQRFLNDDNRKIHFFFIDYSKANKRDGFGYLQSDYLEAASVYFNNPAHKIFGKTTDAIYVVLTKSDLMPCSKEQRVEKAKEHLNNARFTSFINALKDNCKKYSINAGRLTVEPFSLGKVYFKQLCDFEDSAANRIIEILIERIAPSKKSILDVFNK